LDDGTAEARAPSRPPTADLTSQSQDSTTESVNSTKCRQEIINERVHVAVAVVQRRRRDAQDVRLAKIAQHAFLIQPLDHPAAVLRNADRQLCAPALRIARRDDGKLGGLVTVE